MHYYHYIMFIIICLSELDLSFTDSNVSCINLFLYFSLTMFLNMYLFSYFIKYFETKILVNIGIPTERGKRCTMTIFNPSVEPLLRHMISTLCPCLLMNTHPRQSDVWKVLPAQNRVFANDLARLRHVNARSGDGGNAHAVAHHDDHVLGRLVELLDLRETVQYIIKTFKEIRNNLISSETSMN